MPLKRRVHITGFIALSYINPCRLYVSPHISTVHTHTHPFEIAHYFSPQVKFNSSTYCNNKISYQSRHLLFQRGNIRTRELIHLFPILVKLKGRHGTNTTLLCQFVHGIDIHLNENGIGGIFSGHGFEVWGDHSAGSAPVLVSSGRAQV